jgi:hypothetical protein
MLLFSLSWPTAMAQLRPTPTEPPLLPLLPHAASPDPRPLLPSSRRRRPTARRRVRPPPSFSRHVAIDRVPPPTPPCIFLLLALAATRVLPFPFLFRAVLSKMGCVGVALSIRGCLVSTPGSRRASGSEAFEATSPPTTFFR